MLTYTATEIVTTKWSLSDFRSACLPVLRCVKPGKVLAEDFLLRVALEAVGTGISAADVAADIDHIDRVVRDRVDENPVAFVKLLRVY